MTVEKSPDELPSNLPAWSYHTTDAWSFPEIPSAPLYPPDGREKALASITDDLVQAQIGLDSCPLIFFIVVPQSDFGENWMIARTPSLIRLFRFDTLSQLAS